MRSLAWLPLLIAAPALAGGPPPATAAIRFLREGDSLWILRGGALRVVPLAGGEARALDAPDARPLALARSDAGPRWLARGRDGALTIRAIGGPDGAFLPLAKPDGAVVGLVFDGARPLIVASSALWRFSEANWSRVALPASWERLKVGRAALRVRGGILYAGWDAGAWGGGLFAIELATGRDLGGARGANEETSGNLGAASNVVAIADDPGAKGCLLLGEGRIADGEWEGALERLCGKKIEFLHEQLMPEKFNEGRADWNTWPVWDLAVRDGRVWVSREDGLFAEKIFPYFKPVTAPPAATRDGDCEWLSLRDDLVAARCDGDPRWRFAE